MTAMTKKKYSHPSQEEWNNQDQAKQELYDNPTDDNARKYREANDKVKDHYRDRDYEED